MAVGDITTNFPGGVTNTTVGAMATLPEPDPSMLHQYFDDFNSYTTGQWINTVTGTGVPALIAGNNGILQFLNSANNGDAIFAQRSPAAFQFIPGKRAWFKARIQVSDAVNSGFMIGVAIVGTTPFTSTDGIYFYSAAGSANLTAFVRKDATMGSTSVVIGTLANATDTDLSFYYDGAATVQFFVNGAPAGSLSGAAAFLPDATNLTVTVGIQNGAAAAKSANVDYIFAATER